ncbi:MAG TPA: hypothetical protein VFR54_00300 [Xanthobacteraceae bacterium]|jgi:hypothetical protein|nr:hypothetical protein [Xanthobacteraceae bacterium]
MPRQAVLALVLFAALVLSAALGALAASGHFPHERRAAALRGGLGGAVLFGACAVLPLSLIVGAVAAWRILDWPAAVIAGGAAILAAPLLLRPLPDRLVNGRAALIVFSGASLLLALALASL